MDSVPSDEADAKGRTYPFNGILAELESRLTVGLSEPDEHAVITVLVKTFALAQRLTHKSMAEQLRSGGVDILLTESHDWNAFAAWAATYGHGPEELEGT